MRSVGRTTAVFLDLGSLVTNNSLIYTKQPFLSDYFKGLRTIYVQLNHCCDTKGEGGGVILLVFVTYNPE